MQPVTYPPEPGTARGFNQSGNREPDIAETQGGVGRDHAEIRPHLVERGTHYGIGGQKMNRLMLVECLINRVYYASRLIL
jgi:hypothetical protein